MVDTSSPSHTPPSVQNKAAMPPGILPRHTQAWVLGGLALLMVAVIAFSGRNTPPENRAKDKAPPLSVVDPSQARIQEYRARIEEQARKLAAEQAQLAQAKQAIGLPPTTADPTSLSERYPAGRHSAEVRPASQGPGAYPSYAPPALEKSWIETDREKRNYQSLFASNVVLSYRKETRSDPESLSPDRPIPQTRSADTTQTLTALTQAVSKIQRDSSTPSATGTAERPPADETLEKAHGPKNHADINRAEGKEYRLFEGTALETVLTNRLDGAFSGPVNCMVTANVYSHNRQHLLIPQGSRVLGEVRRVETFGQERLAVSFHRLIMPDGYTVSLDQFRGLNQIGETGLRDKVNHHYLQVFGVSLAIGAIAGLSQANTRYGLDQSALDAYRQGVAGSLSQSSLRILDRYLNVLPTFTIREGHRVKVYLSDDLLLPAYDNHQMPNDI